MDGLKGFPEAITSVFPQAQVQTCIVHMVRHSLRFVPWKDRKEVAADLKAIYRAETGEAARDRLSDFEEKWGGQVPHYRARPTAQLGEAALAGHREPGSKMEDGPTRIDPGHEPIRHPV